MSRAVRQFYARYHLLTAIAPAYVMALIFYGTAWLLSPGSPLMHLSILPGLYLTGVVVFIGISRLLGALGFLISGVPAARITPAAADRHKLDAVMDGLGTQQTGATTQGDAARLPRLEPVLVELGAVPYLAQGGLSPGVLWISTHLLRNTDVRTLRYLVAHELGHAATGGTGCASAWYDAFWLAAYPLAFLFGALEMPLMIVAAGLVHALLWLRLSHTLRLRDETRADSWAAGYTGRLGYAAALVAHHREVAGSGFAVLRLRLQRLGLSREQIDELREKLADPTGASS